MKLHVSVKTVETHRAHIKEKLNLQNATQLVQACVRWVEENVAGKSAAVLSREPNARYSGEQAGAGPAHSPSTHTPALDGHPPVSFPMGGSTPVMGNSRQLAGAKGAPAYNPAGVSSS